MNAATLLDVLLDAAHRDPDHVVVHVRGDGSELSVTFRELLEESLRVAGGYRDAGVVPGTCVPVVADRGEDFQPLFWGALAAGLVPVPLAPDVRRVRPVWEHLGRPPVAVDEACADVADRLDGARVLRLEELRTSSAVESPATAAPDDLAFLQFSSGSTGAPKGVELTHAAVLANLRQLIGAAGLTDRDVVVGWMPYFHDMGLIGTHLAPLAARAKQVRIAPLSFAKNPRLWFEVAAAHRATLLSAANFALALTVRRVPEEVFAGLDLSTVRRILVGAEPISATVWRDFAARTRPSGLDPRAATPVYGLAEATLAVTFPPPGEVAVPVVLERAALSRGRVVECEPGGDAVELLDVGLPVPGCSVRVTDDCGRPLGDRRVGHVEVRGPQVARGYHGLPEATAAAFADGWLRTGDLGFLRDGRLCVSGRHKDVLFVNGRTFHAPDMEEVAAATPGVPPGTAVVVGSTDPVTGGERVVVFVAWARPPRSAAGVLDRVAGRVRAALGHDDVRVFALPPSAFPRTTSGKVQRQRMRSRFEAGTYRPTAASGAAPARREPPRPSGDPAPAPRSRARVRGVVREVWAKVLGVPEPSFGDRDRFAELGGGSLKAMEALAELERALDVTLGPAVMRHDTVAALTDHLLDAAGQRAPEHRGAPGGTSPRGPETAVVGLACRFPGAGTPEEFWELLTAGRDAVTTVPAGRWGTAGEGDGRWGAFLDDPAAFDAGHFGIGAEEARALDPQARIFLELAHEALERAGYAGPRRRGLRIGVFAAVGDSGYRQVLAEASPGGAPSSGAALTGNLPNLVAARVAHCLDLDGPALAVDTACSSGLVALHLARRSLADGECDIAVVGGVNLHLTPAAHRSLEAAQALSPTGRSRAFGAAADGFVPGEGGAALVVRRLAEARRDDDAVLAVVRGTAVNNDGTSLSLMAPNPLRQREVITRAYRDCGVDPASVTYVEAHGTGTAVGDPVELRSLAHAFPPRPDGRPRLLGSVKTNIGHLLNAAALPSLVKVVLALGHGRLPASLHHTPPSPAVERAGFALVPEETEWESDGPRRAGVNAFGFGGTNAHAVLEEAPPAPERTARRAGEGPHLLTLSADSAEGLAAWASRLAEHLRDHPEPDEAGVCAAVGAARDERPRRLALVVDGDLRERLAAGRGAVTGTVTHRPRIVFVLPGQGGLRPGPGRELYATAPVYRATLDEASAAVGEVCGRKLTDWCVEGDVTEDDLAATEVAQPLLVAHGVALARQLTAWGVRPDAVVGHSVGELAAACVGGTLSLREAVTFAAERGRLMGGSTAPGAMAAVLGAAEPEVSALVDASGGELAVAAYNGPGRLVISGTPEAVGRASRRLTGQGAAVRPLRVARAFHSPLMEPVAQALADAARALAPTAPTTPVMSTLTAAWQPPMTPEHLREHALRPVRFDRAVARLVEEGYDTFVELGPTRTVPPTAGAFVLPAVEAPGGARQLMETVARLWVRGVPLDRPSHAGAHPRTPLPPYPYRRRRYWPGPTAPGLLHDVVWRPAPAPLADGRAAGAAPRERRPVPARPGGDVAVTGPDPAAARRLADRLVAHGVRAVTATDGAEAPETVVLVGDAARPQTAADLDRHQHEAATALRDALALLDRAGARRLLVVTHDAHATGHGPERPNPAQAILGGLSLAVPGESAGVVANWVDLSSLDDEEQHLRALLAETSAPQAEGAVAWRAGQRLVRSVVPRTGDRTDGAPPLPADGAYLVTGGAGGIGSALARRLADRARPVLVLAGRSPRPPRGLLEELTALGADARYVAADLTVPDDVERLVAGLPPLDAVFHAAGVARPGSLRGTDVRETVDALGAKTLGTVLLAGALDRHGQHPAVCVAFSSVSSVLPGLAGALGAYAAANAFLDSFAGSERRAGRPWLSVNLGPFGETGLAAAGAGALPDAAGRPLSTAPALAALRSVCGTDAAQLVLADLAPVAPAATPVPPSTAGGTGERTPGSSGTAAVLRELLARSLEVPAAAVDDDTPFLTLGLDSLGAVDLVKRLERRLGRDLPTTLFFEHRTVRELAAHLDGGDPERPDGEPFALTPVQLALHTSSLLHPDVPARGHLRLTIRGPLDTGVLGRALSHLADRHGALRLRVDAAGPRPAQWVAAPVAVEDWYEVLDCAAEDVSDVESAVCNRPFDLTAGPPVRAVLLRQEPELAHLLLVVHHAAADGYSLSVLAEELWAAYTALWREEPAAPPAPAPDFARYVAGRRHSGVPDGVRHYWAERLATRGEPLRLPWDGDPDAPAAGPVVQHHGAFDAELSTGLERLAAAHGVSLFHLLLAAYARCLARWTGRRDIAVNVARAGRDDRFDGVDRLVGPLADTLPLLCEVDGGEPVVALAERLRGLWLETERHAGVSSLDLAGMLPGAGAGPRTVSPAGFSFARFPAAAVPGCPVEVRATAAGTGSATTRLSLLCWADGPVLRVSWNFPEPLFERATVARLDREFRAELAALVPTPGPAPSALPEGPLPLVARLLDRFRSRPGATAVDAGEASLTYGALDRASAALAARLRAHGVRPGDLVGLLTEPGADTVVGVVGILRAGAGWVPLDPEHPRARLTDQLTRTGASTVVCHSPTLGLAGTLAGVRAVTADGPSDDAARTAAVAAPEAGAIAYVIFTSGSTGRPKAVPVTHRAMENYLDWAVGAFGYGPDDRLAQTASPCFDASVRQLLAPLMTGGTVVTVPRHLLRDPELLLAHVERTRVTVWSSVPTLWEQLLSAAEARAARGGRPVDLSALRWVHVGGEALPVEHVRRWFDLFGSGTRIANLYGPTETTVNATCHVIESRPGDEVRRLPIGRSAAGALLEVVGADGAVCGAGEAGELLIAGVGLTPGYLDEPELTARAFTMRGGRRWYRSGDRVRRSADGLLEFLGRVDDQVKIRGNRVEPGEVEAALQGCPGVGRAVVLAREGRLLAFVTPRTGAGRPVAGEVRRHLAGLLPSYMVPARITCVDALPLTGTGKVDRQALLTTDPGSVTGAARTSSGGGGTPPATATERRLAAVWCEVLRVTSVCREDDFFELGGDSLLVLEVFARLAERAGPLPRPTVIYRHRTLAALADAVDAVAGRAPVAGDASPAAAGDGDPGPFPVTAGQRGFLLAEALSPGGGTWLARLRLSGPLDPDLFQRAVDVLVERHGMLRTVFPAGARPPVQQELPRSLRLPVDFETVAGPAEVDERAAGEAERRLEPWAWPLMRLRVLTLEPHEHVLLVHAHHLIGDGYSSALLIRELTEVYDRLAAGAPPGPPAPRAGFRDHALAVAASGTAAPATVEHRARAGRLNAPYRPPVLRTAANAGRGFVSTEFTLDAALTASLRKVASAARTTLYAPLLTAYYQELAALTGRPDLIVGLAVSGRDGALPDAHRIFGPFATAVPVRPAGAADEPLTDGDFDAALRRIAAEAEEARAHEDVVPRHADGLPATAQFFFTYLDFAALAPRAGGALRVSWEAGDSVFLPPSSATDLFLAARPDGEGLRVTVRGCTAAFSPAALDAFGRSVRGRLVRVAGNRRPVAPPPGKVRKTMDAALVGYLPAPGQLARLAGLPEAALPRAEVRGLLFPDGGPRLLETARTPLGRSGFVCVPLFADELGRETGLVDHTARAVSLAASLGARCVSLAGMIPSLTGYGFDVLRHRRYPSAVTTGHATTVVSVVKTVHAALDATGRDLGDLEVAFAGLGSIGASSLELLLSLAARPPRRLLLCDVRGSGPRLGELGRRLRERGLAGRVEVAEAGRMLPDAVHAADLLVTAVSGAAAVLDVDRLRPGAVVVDDSFPHCFDTGRALARMRERGDVLVLGGGLLHVGRTDREVAADLPAAVAAGHLAQPWIEGTLASCRTESLLRASDDRLPLVHGLVDAAVARAHWDAVEAAGVTAAPLHLLGHAVGPAAGAALPEPPSDAELRR